jgi:hypothetical protein
MSKSGACLCGSVTFELPEISTQVSVCHCSICRRQSAGPVMALHGAGTPRISGEASLRWYRSTEWGERGFCKTCGSALFWRMVESGETFVSAGAIADPGDLVIESHIFVDSKPAYYDFVDRSPRLTGAEVAALYAEPDGGPL